jgi:hypothetical protein
MNVRLIRRAALARYTVAFICLSFSSPGTMEGWLPG